MSSNIPVIDLEPWWAGTPGSRQSLSREVNTVCHETGFFYLVNHGITRDTCDRYMDMLQRFFALPQREKARIDKAGSPHFRGWEKLGSERTNNEIDYREQLDIGVEQPALAHPEPYYMALHGPNQWPDEKLIPGFRETVSGFIESLSELSRQLLRIMSLSLGLDEHHIERVFGENPCPYTKLIRYPRTLQGGRGVGVHKDSGFLTLLLQDQHPGLEAQSNTNQWHAVDAMPGSLVVNTGELLQLVTHNYFIATPHRVVNTHAEPRFSSAFFYSPDLNTRLDPLPIDLKFIEMAAQSDRHSGEGLMASRRAEMAWGTGGMDSLRSTEVFGERYWQRWVRSYPEIAKRYYPDHC